MKTIDEWVQWFEDRAEPGYGDLLAYLVIKIRIEALNAAIAIVTKAWEQHYGKARRDVAIDAIEALKEEL